MSIPITFVWFIIGVVAVAMEAVGLTGLGFLFAGLGAFCVALLLESGLLGQEAYFYQIIWFFAATVAWAVALWKPMRRIYHGKAKQPYSNIVGDTATVAAGGLNANNGGNVNWSGTVMRAEIDPKAGENSIEEGATVVVTATKGNMLIVKRK